MNTEQIVKELNSEITRLEEARSLLTKTPMSLPKQRHLSADARARISAAQKKRWAKQRRRSKVAA